MTAPGGGARARRPLTAVTALALAAGITATALAACSSSVRSLHQPTNNYSVRGHVQTVVVTNDVGDVQVSGVSTGTVSVVEHMTFRDLAPVTRHQVSGGTLHLTGICPAAEICSVSYDITVPRATSVRVTDRVGSIRVDSLSGQLTAHTQAGKIDLDAVSGAVEASTDAGTISGQALTAPRATLQVSAGAIDAAFAAPPAAITATTSVGAVTLRVPGNVSYRVDASATVGAVEVSVTRSAGASREITASTRTGAIIIEPT